jgi:hypothetical protein
MGKKNRQTSKFVITATFWSLWKLRNSIIFQQAKSMDLAYTNLLVKKGFVVVERRGRI